jgi:demethoxyubiquinone hydroxylase (CLK1/Coq7/Cat5 family)
VSPIQPYALPEHALLGRYAHGGAYDRLIQSPHEYAVAIVNQVSLRVVEPNNPLAIVFADHSLPEKDQKSRVILEQLVEDEAQHGAKAQRAGGAPMPAPVRLFMKLTSKVMTETAYWI